MRKWFQLNHRLTEVGIDYGILRVNWEFFCPEFHNPSLRVKNCRNWEPDTTLGIYYTCDDLQLRIHSFVRKTDARY